ncbi:MAG: PAS domain S-box protein [Gallionella sp.]
MSFRNRLKILQLTPAGIALLYAVLAALWIILSGYLLTFTVSDALLQSRIELAKGLAFVAVTSGLLYLLLKGWNKYSGTATPVSISEIAKPNILLLMLTLILLVMVVPAMDLTIYEQRVPARENSAYQNLGAIAELKGRQIEQWLAERSSDAQGLADNTGFVSQMEDFQSSAPKVIPNRSISGELRSMLNNHGFDTILLFAPDGRLLSSLGSDTDKPPENLIHQALSSGRIIFSDLYRNNSGNIYLDWLVPVTATGHHGKRTVGLAVLRTLPGKFLYPLIQVWPEKSSSGETLLVRSDGNEVQFLNDLRFHKKAALTFYGKLANPDLPAAIAVRANQPGTTSGTDYRGIPVLAAYRPVAGTGWQLIAKQDRSEILQPVRDLLYWVSAIGTVAVFMILALLLMFLRQQQRTQRLALQARTAESLRENNELLRLFIEHAPVALAMFDRDMRYLAFSLRWMKDYALDNQQLIGRSHYEIFPEISARWRALHARALAGEVLRSDEDRFERADGSVQWLQWEIRPWLSSDGNVGGIVIFSEDITERKHTDESVRKLLQAVEQSPSSIVITDLDANIEYANPAFATESGYGIDEVIGSNPRLLHSGKTPKATYEDMWAHLINGKSWEGEFINRRKDGSEYVESAIISPVFQPDGRMTHFLAVKENITERKAAEEKITRQTQLYAALSECNQAIVRCASEQELFPIICRVAVQFGGMKLAWIGLVDEAGKQVNPVASYGTGSEYLEGTRISLDAGDPFGRGPTGTAIRENRAYWCQEYEQDPNLAPWRDKGIQYGMKSSAALPLSLKGTPVGCLTIYSDTVNAFDEDARRLLTEVATDISFALDNFAREAERKQAEELLRHNEALLAEVGKIAMVGGWEFDPRTGEGTWTQEVARIYDMDAGEKTSRDIGLRYFQGESKQKIEAAISAAIADGTPYDLELELVTAKGNHKWVRTIALVEKEEGEIVRLKGTLQDITKLKVAQQELEFKNTILTTQQETTLDAILVVGGDGHIISYNQQFIDMWRLSVQVVSAGNDEPVLQSVTDQVANTEAFFARVSYLYEHREDKSREEIPLKDGRIIDRYSAPITGADGHYYGRVWYFRDISERKHAEQELLDSEQRFRGLVEQSLAGIYIIQDGKLIYVNPRAAEIVGHGSVDDLIGNDFMQFIASADQGKVAENMRKLLDKEVSKVALEFCVVHAEGHTITVGANASYAFYHGQPAVIGLVQDISEKKRDEERILTYVDQLKSTFMSTVQLATSLSEMRDPYTAGHERRVSEIAVAIATELGMDEQHIEGIKVAGYLHDIGKISIPSEILVKPGRLNATEYALVQGHAQASYDVLKIVPFPWPVATIALQHHERMDGSGYPNGLKGDEILLESRIMAVADVVEAMASHRPYRPGLGIDKALAEITRGSGTLYDPVVADACLRLFREQKFVLPPV